MSRYRLALVSRDNPQAITLADAKKQVELGSSNTAHDGHLLSLITAASLFTEQRLGHALILGTWDFFRNSFPVSVLPIVLPLAPLSSVTSIKYYAPDGTLTTWGSSNYTAIPREPSEIHLAPNCNWPAIQTRVESVQVRFVAGYGTTPDAVPMPLRQAVLMLVAHWFETRGASGDKVGAAIAEVPLAYESLVSAYATGDEFTYYSEGVVS
jgi:uncharacterized phiE125 gp8 family phage protein